MGKIHSIRIFGSVLLGGGLATAAVLATTSCNGKPDGDKYLNIWTDKIDCTNTDLKATNVQIGEYKIQDKKDTNEAVAIWGVSTVPFYGNFVAYVYGWYNGDSSSSNDGKIWIGIIPPKSVDNLPSGEHKVEVDISLYDHGDDKKVLEDVKYTIDLNVQDEI